MRKGLLYITALSLASAVIVMILLPNVSSQSGRVAQSSTPTPSPTPQTTQPKVTKSKSTSILDHTPDEYVLIFPTSYEGSLRKRFANVNRVIQTLSASLVEQLNKSGGRGYKLVSIVTGEAGYPISIVPVGITRFDEGRYEYQQFQTTSDLFFVKSAFEEKYAEFSKEGFCIVAHSLLYTSCEPAFVGDRGLGIPDIGEKCESRDLFLLEKEKSARRPTHHVLLSSVPGWRGHPSVEMATQIKEKLAQGFYPSEILSKFEILLEQTEKNDDLLTSKPDVEVIRSSLGLRDDAIVKKEVNKLALQGYRLALVNNEIALMYRRTNRDTPVTYIWLDAKKKDFENQLAKLQESGASYRMTYPNRQGDKEKLIFEQRLIDNGERREYKVLKFQFQETENAAQNKVQIDLTPVSKETVKLMNSLVAKGFIVRDLFVSDKVSVLLERTLISKNR